MISKRYKIKLADDNIEICNLEAIYISKLTNELKVILISEHGNKVDINLGCFDDLMKDICPDVFIDILISDK